MHFIPKHLPKCKSYHMSTFDELLAHNKRTDTPLPILQLEQQGT